MTILSVYGDKKSRNFPCARPFFPLTEIERTNPEAKKKKSRLKLGNSRRRKMKRSIKILVSLTVICAVALPAHADVHVRGYLRSDGTPVTSHYRSNPDGDLSNNWSTYPNVNPYTGVIGTKRISSYSPSYSWPTPSKRSSSSSAPIGALLFGIAVFALLSSSSSAATKKKNNHITKGDQ